MLLRARDGCAQLDKIGDSRWAICNVLRHAMCPDAPCAKAQMAGESWDKQCSELAHSQHRDGEDSDVQVVWIGARFSDLTHDGEGIDAQQCRSALGRASLLIVNGSSRSICPSEFPRAVAS